MDFKAARDTVRAMFHTAWGTTTKVSWPDVHFTIPNNETWIRFDMKHNEGYQASAGSPGSNRFRREGVITIQVFAPEGDGANDAADKADAVADIFIGKTENGIQYYDTTSRDVGNDENGFFQINVTTKFKYDRIT